MRLSVADRYENSYRYTHIAHSDIQEFVYITDDHDVQS